MEKSNQNLIKNVDDLAKVERKLEVIDDDEDTTTTSNTPNTPTEEKTEEKEEDTPTINKERAKHPDPVGNGGITSLYSWTQSLKDFSLIIPIDEEVKSKQIKLDYTKFDFNLKIKGKDYLTGKKFPKEIRTPEFVWTIEVNEMTDEKTLNITCEKMNQMEWWESMFEGDQKINLDKINAEQSNLSDLDGETRQTVEKMM